MKDVNGKELKIDDIVRFIDPQGYYTRKQYKLIEITETFYIFQEVNGISGVGVPIPDGDTFENIIIDDDSIDESKIIKTIPSRGIRQ